MTTVAELGHEVPWHRSGWYGTMVSLDGVQTMDFQEEDIAEVVAYYQSADDWEGKCAGIVRLKDERFCGWESWWECTGSGFRADAYGGNADILFSREFDVMWRYFSERTRELLRESVKDQMLEALTRG